ncbi:MAG: flippase-like domain-containing protein [Armatimonadetes bacterium]|nr:flippase-like domain-containing protein [Armatimonadota bacterium]
MKSEPEPRRPTPSRWWWTGLRLVVAAALVVWLLARARNREALSQVQVSVSTLAVCVVLYALCQALNCCKWGLILGSMAYPVRFGRLLRLYFIGMFANWFLPTSVGGDLVRMGYLTAEGVPFSIGALSVFMQRFTGMAAILLIGLVLGFGGVLMAGATAGPWRGTLEGTAVLALVALGVAVALAVLEERWRLGERLPAGLGRPLKKVGAGLRAMGRAPLLLLAVVVLSVLFQSCMVGLNAILGAALGVRLAAVHWTWVVAVATVSEMFPLAPGGLGTRELTMASTLQQLGFAQGAAVSLALQAAKLLTSLPGGVLMLVAARRVGPPVEDAA